MGLRGKGRGRSHKKLPPHVASQRHSLQLNSIAVICVPATIKIRSIQDIICHNWKRAERDASYYLKNKKFTGMLSSYNSIILTAMHLIDFFSDNLQVAGSHVNFERQVRL